MKEDDEREQVPINGAVQVVREYKNRARELRAQSQIRMAGDYYVATSHGYLLTFRKLPNTNEQRESVPTPYYPGFGYAIQDLLLGSLCYRLADAPKRCENHCRRGELIVEDLRHEGLFTADAERGLLQEMIGDFRLVGDLGDHDDAYAKAAEMYADVTNDIGWSMEPGFEDVMQIPLELAESADMGVDEDRKTELMYESLEERIAYKRATYPEIIEATEDAGNWESDLL